MEYGEQLRQTGDAVFSGEKMTTSRNGVSSCGMSNAVFECCRTLKQIEQSSWVRPSPWWWKALPRNEREKQRNKRKTSFLFIDPIRRPLRRPRSTKGMNALARGRTEDLTRKGAKAYRHSDIRPRGRRIPQFIPQMQRINPRIACIHACPGPVGIFLLPNQSGLILYSRPGGG